MADVEEMVVETVLVENQEAETNLEEGAVVDSTPYSMVTTLSDGTVVELVPYEEFPDQECDEIDDQNLHDAARIILECAENSRLSANAGASTAPLVPMATDPAAIETVTTDAVEIDENVNDQTRVIRNPENPKKGYCTGCQKPVVYKNRKRHLSLVHQIHIENEIKMTKCIHPDCDREFYMVKSMMKHLEQEHGVEVETKELFFASWDDFLAWKSTEEDTNFVYFSKRNGDCVRGDKTLTYYVCQRDGSKKPHRSKNYVPTGRQYRKGRAKTDLTCPARIKAYRNSADESVRVVYTFSHNHSITLRDTVHQPLSKNKLAKIKSKLQQGLNSDKIHALMNFMGESDAADPAHMVSKRRIDGIKKKVNKDSRLSSEECDSVHLLLTRLQEMDDSPIVLYVSEGVFVYEDHIFTGTLFENGKMFLVLYQTEQQLNMMREFGPNALILDTDGMMDNNRNQLVNILVADEFHMAYPVAHIITNNLSGSLKMCLETLKERAPDLSNLSLVFAPNEEMFAKAFREVFDNDISFFIGRWEAIRQWEKRIKQTIFSSTIRRDLCRMLCLLLDEDNSNRFEVLLEVFVKEFQTKADRFLRFFDRHYVFDVHSWAICYRDFAQYGTEKVDFMRKFLSRLEWWLGERATNKRIDDLINLLGRIEREWCVQRQVDVEHRPRNPIPTSKHELSLTISDDNVQTIKLNGSSIWLVKPHTDHQKSNVVKIAQEICQADFCWDRCSDPQCAQLCSHLYTCNCDDGTGLCEHIHKVRSYVQNYNCNEENLEVEVMNMPGLTEDVLSSIEVVHEVEEAHSEQQVLTISPDVYEQLQAGTDGIVLYMTDEAVGELGEKTTDAGEEGLVEQAATMTTCDDVQVDEDQVGQIQIVQVDNSDVVVSEEVV